jgi:hypothetical protein
MLINFNNLNPCYGTTYIRHINGLYLGIIDNTLQLSNERYLWRIEIFEDSKSAITREVKEELGYELDFDLCSIQENFVIKNNQKIMQYCFCYKAIYNGEIKKDIFKCKDNDGQQFYWVNINELSKYKIYPESTYDLLSDDKIAHYIEKVNV